MNTSASNCLLLMSALLSTGCTLPAPTNPVSEAVIETILPTVATERPWRLSNAWQGGHLGGSALRGSSIEPVLQQDVQKPVAINVAAFKKRLPVFVTPDKFGCKPDRLLK